MQLVWDMLWDPKTSIFCDTPGLHFDKTPRGYMVKTKLSHGGSIQNSFPIKGEYNPTALYNLNDICIVSLGANAGTYVRITSNNLPNQPPWVGNNFWMQLPMGTTTGVWM